MAQVTVNIDDKAYRMACEEGQEDHLTELAARFDKYVSHLKTQFGEIGDLRITVMSGIMGMDELHEVQRKMRGLESELDKVEKTDSDVAAALEQVAARIEAIAAKLNV